VWLFTDNHDYYPGGSRRHQAPLTSVQAHVGYTVRPRLWLSAGVTWFGGGQATVNDGPLIQSVSNARFGWTLSLPVGAMQSLKVSASTGLWTRTGSDFDAIAVTWQVGWIDKPRKRASNPYLRRGSRSVMPPRIFHDGPISGFAAKTPTPNE
jgi:hypothetical protein